MAVINLGLTAQTTGLTPLYDPAYPTGNRPAGGGTETITGTGFGTGPTVIMFDTMQNNTDGNAISLSGADIGTWAKYNNITAGIKNTDTAYAWAEDGRLWMAGREPAAVAEAQANRAGLVFNFGALYKEFLVSYRWKIASGYKMPGGATINTVENISSNWKVNWLYNSALGELNGDVVIQTFPSSGQSNISGNAFYPNGSTSGHMFIDYGKLSNVDNLITYYQSDNSTGTTGAFDADQELMQVSPDGYKREDNSDVDPWAINSWGGVINGYDTLIFNSWMGNSGVNTMANVMPLLADIYIAVGPNARARIITHNAATLATSTQAYVIPPDSWSDTEITFTPLTHEDLTYRSVVEADGTVQENV